ncbi:hypothetical protein AB0D59_05095 [Streptomyces sp. NPDC048417]|uniref:hypothetical protein n=1 Tax=Streptomyces sp. NPDC048417 TaxID=3155387 RepID=UPI00343C598D
MSATNAVAYPLETLALITALDADLIGAWDRSPRPHVFEKKGGQYRFGPPQS